MKLIENMYNVQGHLMNSQISTQKHTRFTLAAHFSFVSVPKNENVSIKFIVETVACILNMWCSMYAFRIDYQDEQVLHDIEIKPSETKKTREKEKNQSRTERGRKKKWNENDHDNEMSPRAGFTHNLQSRHETAWL